MPRSASDRDFGFKSAGLLRILTASDPGEVLTAMEALGITLLDETTFFDLIVSLTASFARPVRKLLDLLQRVENLAALLETNPFAQIGPAGVPLQVLWGQFRGDVSEARLRLLRQQASFREAIADEEARALVREIQRRFAEDPRGPMFQQPEEA